MAKVFAKTPREGNGWHHGELMLVWLQEIDHRFPTVFSEELVSSREEQCHVFYLDPAVTAVYLKARDVLFLEGNWGSIERS